MSRLSSTKPKTRRAKQVGRVDPRNRLVRSIPLRGNHVPGETKSVENKDRNLPPVLLPKPVFIVSDSSSNDTLFLATTAHLVLTEVVGRQPPRDFFAPPLQDVPCRLMQVKA